MAFSIEGYMRAAGGPYTGKTPAVGFTAGSDSPDFIGRALWQRPALWWLVAMLLSWG